MPCLAHEGNRTATVRPSHYVVVIISLFASVSPLLLCQFTAQLKHVNSGSFAIYVVSALVDVIDKNSMANSTERAYAAISQV
jgi:hypothetical protein